MKKFIVPFSSSWGLIALSAFIGVTMYFAANLFLKMIHFISHLCFAHELSLNEQQTIPSHNFFIIFVPIIGAFILGMIARFYDDRIRGHGIPEVIERIESFEANIPVRLLWLRPIACAISIGTGGPYGAEGPVIGMGAAMGSVVAQLLKLSFDERKILLASGAAAGISAVFGTPVGAVFLVTELFLRTHAIRSLVPIGIASFMAFIIRTLMIGSKPLFPMHLMTLALTPHLLIAFSVIALALGITAVITIHAIELIENGYEKLPIHWMWWPVIGVLPLSFAAYFFPDLLGPSYELLSMMFTKEGSSRLLIQLALLKGVVWMFAVSSRTTAGTLAPLLIMGAGVSLLVFTFEASFLSLPSSYFSVAALLGAGAFFGAISGAPISSALIVLEMTGSLHLLPLCFGVCLISVLVTKTFANQTIMQTEYS